MAKRSLLSERPSYVINLAKLTFVSSGKFWQYLNLLACCIYRLVSKREISH